MVVSPSCVQLFGTPRTAACQAPHLPHHLEVFPSSDRLHRWCHPAILSSDTLISFCPPSFPESGTFRMQSAVFIRWPKSWSFSFTSVLPMSILGWFPLRLTGLISLLSKGLLGVFSSTTVWKHWSFGFLLSLWSRSHNCTWPLGRP